MDAKRKTAAGVALVLALILLALLVWITEQAYVENLSYQRGADSTSAYVYEKMEQVGVSLKKYEESRDFADLSEAATALERAAAVCSAWNDCYAYRASSDNASDIIQAWGVCLMVKAYNDVQTVLQTGVITDEAAAEIAALTDIFQPDEAGQVDFFSLFWNFDQSSLFGKEDWILTGYDADEQLIWPDF